jgi:hypothetical protein
MINYSDEKPKELVAQVPNDMVFYDRGTLYFIGHQFSLLSNAAQDV